jgi:hypothetical protein
VREVRRRACIDHAVPGALPASCADQTDTRPETADYIIQAILVPFCGRAGCHTSETQPHNLAFDTIDDELAAMKSSDRDMVLVVPGDPSRSELVTILSESGRIMPPDSPLPQADIDLISRSVADGASGLE